MIRIVDKSKCCGCTACMNICPVQCIVMRRDREGFDYPVADPDRCISCGRCETVCPLANQKKVAEPVIALAARSPEFVEESSSGGIFPLLARKVIEDSGAVFGAVMNPDLTVCHTEAEDMTEVHRMRGSKYVQSELYGALEDVKAGLEKGRKVMFTGTPCQIAGLKAYLHEDYEGLLLVDCACHGVPSPGLWEKYVKALGEKYAMKINHIDFRGKHRSWRKYDFVISVDGRKVSVPRMKDPYMALFLQDMTLRPSCYQCTFRKGRSGSDLTLADLWNVTEAFPEMDDDRGVSLILVNTPKGQSALDEAGVIYRSLDPELALRRNGGFADRLDQPQNRNEFFKGVHSAEGLIRYMKGYIVKESLPISIYRSLHSLLAGIKRRLKK